MFKSKYATSNISSIKTSQTQGKDLCVREDTLVDVYPYPSGKAVVLRLFGPVMSVGKYWVSTKKRDGKKGQFPIGCSSWDPMQGTRDPNKDDPWRDFEQKEYDEGIPRNEHKVRFSVEYFCNAIIRSLQERPPRDMPEPTAEEAKTHFKDKDSDSWTPVRVVRLPLSVLDKVQKYKAMNVARSKKTGRTATFDLTHEKFGCDITIMYDEKAAGAMKYTVNKDSRTPLTEEEMNYLVWDLDKLYVEYDPNDMQQSFDSWFKRNFEQTAKKAVTREEDDFEDAEEVVPAKKAKLAKKSSQVEEEPAEVEERDEFDDEEDASVATQRAEAEDDFDDPSAGSDEPWESQKTTDDDNDDLDELDDFEEEKPKKPSKKSEAKKPSKKDDDLNDFDELDDF